ncbi:MAG: hypothetical protein MJ164_01980 [Alphaproteobacteria bacterium]|nr:hypothetical protein [Alphaproteobacteria bacterium]
MHKKHIFLRVFQKITIFACVFCVFSACADTTTCDINYTPVTGNSIQNGTPTPTNPVEIESVGTKVGNKYQISVTAQGKNLYHHNVTDILPSSYFYLNTDGTIDCFGTPTTYTGGCIMEFKVEDIPDVITVKDVGDSVNGQFYGNILDASGTLLGQITSGTSATVFKKSDYPTMNIIRFYAAKKLNDIEMSGTIKPTIVRGTTAATSYAPYSEPTTTPIYLNAPLRKVGDYADVLDYKNGTITRNVGVKVFDGTENWILSETTTAIVPITGMKSGKAQDGFCTHAINDKSISHSIRFGWSDHYVYWFNVLSDYSFGDITTFKSWLAQQYAAGTPVIVYYPLATPVVEQIENWSCIPPITDIKIATTKMVDDEFKAAEAKLATTVQTIESVVSRTIAQTGQIQVLQDTKQTRPDENCPANMKCLLVQDEDGTPHWYPIIEP